MSATTRRFASARGEAGVAGELLNVAEAATANTVPVPFYRSVNFHEMRQFGAAGVPLARLIDSPEDLRTDPFRDR